MDRPWASRIWFLLIILAAFALRIWDLAGRPLWFDESMEFWVATASLSQLPEVVRQGLRDPPLYSLLLHFWMYIDTGEFVLRFLSVLFSTVSVAGVMRIGHRLSSPAAGLIAGAMMAAMPTEIRYAQDAGQYAMIGSLVTCSLAAMLELERQSSWQTFLLVALLSLGAAYAYYGAMLPVTAMLGVSVAAGMLRKDWRALRPKMGVLGAYALGIVPLATYFLPVQLPQGPTSHGLQVHLAPALVELRRLATSTRDLIAFLFTGAPWSVVPPNPFAGVTALSLLLGAIGSLRASKAARQWLLWTVATWGIYYAAGTLKLCPYGFRYGLILTPLLIPLMAQGFAIFRGRSWLRYGAAGLCVTIAVISLTCLPNRAYLARTGWASSWVWPEEEDLPQVIDYWRVRGGEATSTYVYYGAVPAFAYHLGPEKSRPELRPDWYILCWHSDMPDLCAAGNLRYGKWLRDLDVKDKVASVQAAFERRPKALWLIFSHVYPGEDRQLVDGLLESYRVDDVYEVKGAAAYLLEQSGS
jgi:4-amino-4-deoxy-L-arabinose transferase-like glycosyltransferase